MSADDGPAFFPGHGGVAGLVKTVAREWPAVRTKVIDTDGLESFSDLATKVLREMLTGDVEVEVGYQGSRRLVLQPTLSPQSGGSSGAHDRLCMGDSGHRWSPRDYR